MNTLIELRLNGYYIDVIFESERVDIVGRIVDDTFLIDSIKVKKMVPGQELAKVLEAIRKKALPSVKFMKENKVTKIELR